MAKFARSRGATEAQIKEYHLPSSSFAAAVHFRIQGLWFLGWHASHGCHNPLCVNPAHLYYEPAWYNYVRIGCLGLDKCPHFPFCMRRSLDDPNRPHLEYAGRVNRQSQRVSYTVKANHQDKVVICTRSIPTVRRERNGDEVIELE
jgi:hypothetical protein